MPEIGEIRKAKELGYKGNDKRIWAKCELCGMERWTFIQNGKPKHLRCRHCALKDRYGAHPHNWRGGRYRTGDGYIKISSPHHPNADKWGYVLEHRLVLEQRLDHFLEQNEVGHHLNGIKDDNRPENLIVMKVGAHIALIEPYKERIRQLEKAIERLIDEK